MKPTCIDLFCGLGGWTDGFLAEGYECIGFDIERHDYGSGGYPGQLVLQDILTVHGSQFRDAACIVASPPCQKYSYMAMPWTRAKALIAWHRESPERVKALNALFDACFRIQYEACEAAGRHIPMVVENVKGAQPWVGRAKWHYGSYYLWGDVPALMPITLGLRKSQHVPLCETPAGTGSTSWFYGNSKHEGRHYGVKAPGMNWSDQSQRGQDFTRIAGKHVTKGTGGSWFTPEADGRTKQGHWRDGGCVTRCYNSKDLRRKAASAQIAKIPLPLAQHIARCFKPY